MSGHATNEGGQTRGRTGPSLCTTITAYPYLGCNRNLCQNEGMTKRKSRASDADHADESDGIDFEDALLDVERIVGRLERGDAGLGESLELYAAGVKRLKECQALLNAAERQITLLSGFDADGNPVTEVFEDASEESLEEKQKSRGRRRKSTSPQSRGNGPHLAKQAFEQEAADDDPSSIDDTPGLF